MSVILATMETGTRISALETALGAELPSDYRAFLASHKTTDGLADQVVSTNPDYWGVRRVFELADGTQHVQVDDLFRLVGDVLPSGTVPVAEDEAGNLYLLDCVVQPGTVSWWNHERDVGDDRVDKVAETFSAFIQLLRPSSP